MRAKTRAFFLQENVALQRQVAALKAGQVEYEAMKMEVTRVLEDYENIQLIAEENANLKDYYHSEMNAALATAQHEREKRFEVQKRRSHFFAYK